jgi:hypothetical protein
MASGTLTPTPYQTVFDANGDPVSGALINTYLAGTTTPVATYTDVGLTVANANPIVADSSGRYVAFLSPGGSYKYVITTALGAAIRTVDNITAVPASSASLDVSGIAGETLAAGKAVYLSDGSGGKTAGKWYLADPANTYSSSAAVAVGMTPAAIATDATGSIRLAGGMTGLSSLTVGSTYYASTSGALTATQPTNARIIGVADTTSSLVLNANPGVPNADNGINDFRLTLTTAVPVTTADVTAATTIYLTPYKGNRIALYDAAGNATLYTSAQISIAVPATTNQMYDIWCYANAGVPTLELLAWTNDTTRATAIVLTTTGAYTKTGDLTRRYVGSFRTTGVSGQTEDSAAKRFLFNQYNQRLRHVRVVDDTDTWAYSIGTIRQANASAANQFAFVNGVSEQVLVLRLGHNVSNSTATSRSVSAGFGYDSITAYDTYGFPQELGTQGVSLTPITARLELVPAVGYHYASWLEAGNGTDTQTWYGDGGGVITRRTGITGSWFC